MSKVLAIINTPSMPISGNFWHTVNKFACGFKYNHFNVIVVQSDDVLRSLPNDKDVIFFLGDQGLPEPLHAGYRSKPSRMDVPKTLEILHSEFPKCMKIGWFFHNYASFGYPLSRLIVTGEHFHSPPESIDALACYTVQQQLGESYEPLTFLSSIHIGAIGRLQRERKWKAQFVGAYYKTDWTSKLNNSIIYHTPPEISEELRLETFLKSDVALGLSSDANIRNCVVTERIAEALSFGNVVVSDNPSASFWTRGIVEFAATFEELKDKVDFYYNNDIAREAKQDAGYNWAKQCGTYTHLAQRFIAKNDKLP